MTQRLKKFYTEVIKPQLKNQLNYKNLYGVPKLEKIIIHRGINAKNHNQHIIDFSLKELASITSQKGSITNAKKSIAAFKLRKDMPIGIVTTLRNERMYSFLDRLVNLTLPRIRDFNGLNKTSFDGYGNFTMGFTESAMFPEITYSNLNLNNTGLNITIVTSSKTNEEALILLKAFQMPFRD